MRAVLFIIKNLMKNKMKDLSHEICRDLAVRFETTKVKPPTLVID